MKRTLAIVLAFLSFYSCTTKEKPQEIVTQPAIDSSQLFKGPCAVFVSPDSTEIDSLKKLLGEDDFYTIADDYVYYLGDAQHLLDSADITVIHTEEDTLRFLLNSGAIFQIPGKDTTSLFPVYFFNGDEPPLHVEVMDDFRSQYENVFGK
jgi:hypothetical protein